MKRTLVPTITFLIGALFTYFLFPKHQKDKTEDSKKEIRQSIWPVTFEDSIPGILKLIKQRFGSLSDTSSQIPGLSKNENILLATYFSSFILETPDPIDSTAARTEIQQYNDTCETVKSVWVGINDITDCLGINNRTGNPNSYDGFRFYFAKAINPVDASDAGKTTLVMVATKNVAGVPRTDFLSVGGFTGIFNKFDPCPPPSSCPGTLLFPH